MSLVPMCWGPVGRQGAGLWTAGDSRGAAGYVCMCVFASVPETRRAGEELENFTAFRARRSVIGDFGWLDTESATTVQL